MYIPLPDPPQKPAAKAQASAPQADVPLWGAFIISAIIMTIMIALGVLFSSAASEAHPGDTASRSSGAVLAIFIIVGLVISIAVIASSAGNGKPEGAEPKMLANPPMPVKAPVKAKPGPRDWTQSL